MKLSDLTMTPLVIPFQSAFRHAGAERAQTESVIVKALNDQEGVGEGCPRSYVTGESVDSALKFFNQYKRALIGVSSIGDIQDFVHRFQQEIDANPAAWCAIELALLDLLGKERQLPLEVLLGLAPITQPHRYSAVLSAGSAEGFAKQLTQYKAQGFLQFKIKLSGNAELDTAYVASLRDTGVPPSQVRADANRLWEDAYTAIAYLRMLNYEFWAIEDPIRSMDVDAMARLARECNCRIILDENFLRLEQFEELPPKGPWIINLRVSKMGGLLRSLAVVREAKSHAIPIIVGAQVGETSVLTRAGICAAHACEDALLAQEGAFGTLLLASDPCEPMLMFKKAGILELQPAFSKPGLGLKFLHTA